jgi:hypothetical protein
MDARDATKRTTPGQTQTAGSTKLQACDDAAAGGAGHPPFPREEQSARDGC